jgi:anti-anti-sigma regulatory factor
MSVRADPANAVVSVDTVLDLEAAHRVREAVLGMKGNVAIDCHDARTVDDSALAYLVTTLQVCGSSFTIRGLSWPHTKLLEYLGVKPQGDPAARSR